MNNNVYRRSAPRRAHSAAPGTAPASRSTSGTGCWPMTPTTTAPGSSWTGSSSPPAASAGRAGNVEFQEVKSFAGATRIPSLDRQNESDYLLLHLSTNHECKSYVI